MTNEVTTKTTNSCTGLYICKFNVYVNYFYNMFKFQIAFIPKFFLF